MTLALGGGTRCRRAITLTLDRDELRLHLGQSLDLPGDLPAETVWQGGFLVVNKPSPLPVHKVGRFKEKNLLSLLQKEFPVFAKELRIVNRLDSETSGLVLVAKSAEMAGILGILFEQRKVIKEYEALVFGIPDPKKGSLTFPLGTDLKNWQHMRVHDPEGETARTDYEVLETSGKQSLVKIIPHTGRTHQIRAHFSIAGFPIVGDKIYIDPSIFERYVHHGWQEDMRQVIGADRLLLHATKLSFPHPESGIRVSFESPSGPEIRSGFTLTGSRL